jgi:hypothetical protein
MLHKRAGRWVGKVLQRDLLADHSRCSSIFRDVIFNENDTSRYEFQKIRLVKVWRPICLPFLGFLVI